MAIALIASTARRNASHISTVVSDAIDTTGANCLVVAAYVTNGVSGGTPLTDSKSNTWIALTGREPSISGASTQLYYCFSPTVGSGHTFTYSNGFSYPSIAVSAWSGVLGFVQENGATDTGGSVTSLNSGSVTPGSDGALVVSALSHKSSGTPAVGGGSLSVLHNVAYVASEAIGGAFAYEIQSSAAAVAAAWSWTGGSNTAATAIATFSVSPTPKVGSAVFGVDTTVRAERAIAFGLDGNTNVHSDAGVFKVFGDQVITGDLTVNGTITGSSGSTVRTFGITIDGGGSAITTGVKGFVPVPFAGTITGVRVLSTDASATAGSIVVDIWKDTYTNYPPTNADSITASAPPTLSAANKSNDTTLTGWTTTVTAGDVFGFNVDSASGVTRVVVEVTVTP